MEEDERAGPRVGGYVLAGGRSSRMGRDKALLPLAGQPLIAHAVAKLRRVTGNANILAGEAPGNPALRQFGPLVRDAHPGCGPLAGIEAALLHSPYDWNLILPVDVPFLPAAFLNGWVRAILAQRGDSSPVALLRVDDVPQPTVLMIRREIAQLLTAAIAGGEFKLLPVLRRAAGRFATDGPRSDAAVPFILPIDELFPAPSAEPRPQLGRPLSRAQPAPSRWFANLNTPADFAEAERHVHALDPVDKPGGE